MNRDRVLVGIKDLLGYYDSDGIDAIQSERIQELEEYIKECNTAQNNGEDLVVNAIYDRLMEILRQVNPESELCKYIWEDSTDELDSSDDLVISNPMYSITTAKSYDCMEYINFLNRLPDGYYSVFSSVKLNGHGIRLKYKNGVYYQARTRARSSAGRDITRQLSVIVGRDGTFDLSDRLGDYDFEIRGEWLLPLNRLEDARYYNKDIKSAFTGVSSMGRDSASEEEWGLLEFVAYQVVCDGLFFSSKSEEYEFLESLGFEVPYSWQLDNTCREELISSLPDLIDEFYEDLSTNGDYNYAYYTDGIVVTIDDTYLFNEIGDDGGKYKYGNIAMKVGYWKQDLYMGYIQTIWWTRGKVKLSPVAIIADEEDVATFADGDDLYYITDLSELENYKQLGVVTASGNRVRRVPLYEPSNMLCLDAYRGRQIYFRYGGEAGVVPCYPDGTPLVDGKVEVLVSEDDFDEYGE